MPCKKIRGLDLLVACVTQMARLLFPGCFLGGFRQLSQLRPLSSPAALCVRPGRRAPSRQSAFAKCNQAGMPVRTTKRLRRILGNSALAERAPSPGSLCGGQLLKGCALSARTPEAAERARAKFCKLPRLFTDGRPWQQLVREGCPGREK